MEDLKREIELLKKEIKLKDERHETLVKQYNIVFQYSRFDEDAFTIHQHDKDTHDRLKSEYKELNKKIHFNLKK